LKNIECDGIPSDDDFGLYPISRKAELTAHHQDIIFIKLCCSAWNYSDTPRFNRIIKDIAERETLQTV